MLLIAVLLFILFIFFVPLPIKFSLVTLDNNVYLFIYHIKFDILKKYNKNKKAVKKVEKKAKNRKINLNYENIKDLLIKMNKTRFKPFLKIKINFSYGFEDSAATGLTYGYFYCLSPILYKIMAIFFNMKKFNYNINPDFNVKEFKYNLEIKSIIFISLANVIYVLFITYNKLNRFTKTA